MSPVINKFLVALASVLAVLAVVADNGLTTQEIITLALTGLGAVGVYAIPNASKPQAIVVDRTAPSTVTVTKAPPGAIIS